MSRERNGDRKNKLRKKKDRVIEREKKERKGERISHTCQ